jgi:hypothetical protein
MSQPHDHLNDTDLERSLRALTPTSGRINRDRVMYLAGRRGASSSSIGLRAWAMTAAAALAGLFTGGVATWNLRPPRVVERVVVVREAAPSATASTLAATSAPDSPPAPSSSLSAETWAFDPNTMSESMRLRRQLALYGVEGLPEPPPLVMRARGRGDRSPETAAALLRREMERMLKTGDML